MATTEEKQELVETLKGPRFYRVCLTGYGGESAYINISREAFEFWNKHTEEHGDSDLVQYLINDDPEDCDYDELEIIPKEADVLQCQDDPNDTWKTSWFEAPNEFCHQMGVEYGSAYITVEEVDAIDYNANLIADIIDGENITDLVDKIQEDSDYEYELCDFGEGYEYDDQGDYVMQMYSSEKGQFFEGIFETTGDFDINKIKFIVNEYPNGEDIIDGIMYNDIDIENDGGDTNGKGYSAHVWKTNE